MPRSRSRNRAAPKAAAEVAIIPHKAYSARLAGRILDRLARGESWRRVCEEPGMPSYVSLYVWRRRHREFAEALDLAREAAADMKADLALEAVEPGKAATPSDKLRVELLMKHAAADAPHRWGVRTARATADERAPPREIAFRIKRFELASRADGSTYVREARPEDEGAA